MKAIERQENADASERDRERERHRNEFFFPQRKLYMSFSSCRLMVREKSSLIYCDWFIRNGNDGIAFD